jgi:hypothetical protein
MVSAKNVAKTKCASNYTGRRCLLCICFFISLYIATRILTTNTIDTTRKTALAKLSQGFYGK